MTLKDKLIDLVFKTTLVAVPIFLGLNNYNSIPTNTNNITNPAKIQQRLSKTQFVKRKLTKHYSNQTKSLEQRVPEFEGYESKVLKRYDSTIIDAINFWNNYLKDEKKYIPPSEEDIKKIILIETAWKGIPDKEFFSDPMQVYKDYAYQVIMEKGGEGFFPKKGVKELRNKKLTKAQLSIYCGVGWFIHKSARYTYEGKRVIKELDYSKAPERYNGGGDKEYQEKFNSLQKTQ